VIIRPVPGGYHVDVEPALADGQDRSRTFGDKISAWSFAQRLWSEHKLGCRDMTDHWTGSRLQQDS
jgi:hypothetical protein